MQTGRTTLGAPRATIHGKGPGWGSWSVKGESHGLVRGVAGQGKTGCTTPYVGRIVRAGIGRRGGAGEGVGRREEADAGARGCRHVSQQRRGASGALFGTALVGTLLNGYLVLQRSIPLRTSQLRHILKLLARKD